ncbi:MAG: AraC family transcriptional regulator [Pedobacter sp.]|nr:MAG: AraC family transcriptional regulator [Pedobacter sp.]
MENFKIIGISTETSNQNNQAASDLGALWQRFYAEEIFNKIPNKESDDIYAVYTDYENNYTGKYTAIIGQRVTSINNIPDGLIGREINNEKLLRYKAKGEMPNAILETWKDIWDKDAELNRSYLYDYEVYGSRSLNAENSEVDIYIGIK